MPKKFVVIQTAFIGDVILATPVIEKLHRFYPDASIDVVVRKGNESLFAGHPFIHKVIVWNKKKKKNSNLSRTIRSVRQGEYDVLINLHRFASSGLISMVSGAKERIGFSKNPLSFSFTRRKPHSLGKRGEQPFLHEVDRNLSLIEDLTDHSSQPLKLYPTAEDRITALSYSDLPFITISPASVWFTKQTPEKVWIDFIDQLAGYRVYLLGSENDQDLCSRMAKALPSRDVISLSGQLSFLQSAALMSLAVMNYTNDSAPMHLAGAVNAPVTAVFCSTIPEFGFGPRSDRSALVQIHVELSCRPCGLHGLATCPEGHFRCSQIDVKDLLAVLPPPEK